MTPFVTNLVVAVAVAALAILIQEFRGNRALKKLRNDIRNDINRDLKAMREDTKKDQLSVTFDYTAKGGLKMVGAAGTILGDPEGEIPPIIDDR